MSFYVKSSHPVITTNVSKRNYCYDVLVYNDDKPSEWVQNNDNEGCDYIAFVTFSSHKYPYSSIQLTWNIKSNITCTEDEAEFIRINREINNFCELNKDNVLSCAQRHFNNKYPNFILD